MRAKGQGPRGTHPQQRSSLLLALGPWPSSLSRRKERPMSSSLYGHYEIGRDLVLASLSWPELAEVRDGVEVVLLPVGSNEQHGPNIALAMDIAGAYEFCRKASAMAYPRLLVAPPMPWGVSFHHMNFPGTITLTADTFVQVLVEIVGSLHHHGFER